MLFMVIHEGWSKGSLKSRERSGRPIRSLSKGGAEGFILKSPVFTYEYAEPIWCAAASQTGDFVLTDVNTNIKNKISNKITGIFSFAALFISVSYRISYRRNK